MVIAIMSSVIEEVDKSGKKAWSSHFTDVVSEIELLWCFKAKYNLKKIEHACAIWQTRKKF
ncbi:hypothetical protein BDF21DRAFT_461079 [Thamnidium elegans]|nr:hypothetical protein BDF21DRAFT_461079 [Thamnidium elegans]